MTTPDLLLHLTLEIAGCDHEINGQNHTEFIRKGAYMITLRNLFVGISFFPFFLQTLVMGFSGEMRYQQNMNIGSGLFCLGFVVMAAVLG